jgi:hypothetical protein
MANFGSFGAGFAKTFDANAIAKAVTAAREAAAAEEYEKEAQKGDTTAGNNQVALKAQYDMSNGKRLDNAIPLQYHSPDSQAIDSPATGQPADSDWSRAAARPLPDWYVNGKQPVKDGIAQVPEWYDKGALPPKEAAPAPAPSSSSRPSTTVQLSGTGGDQKQAIQPMSRDEYEQRSAHIANDRQLSMLQAKRKYYAKLGKTEEVMKIDKEIGDVKENADTIDTYYKLMGGDKSAEDEMIDYANATSMIRGEKLVRASDGTINHVDASGKVLQANVQFSRQQKASIFSDYVARRNFFKNRDLAAFNAARKNEQDMAMEVRKQASKERADVESEKNTRRGQDLTHAAAMYGHRVTDAHYRRYDALNERKWNEGAEDRRINTASARLDLDKKQRTHESDVAAAIAKSNRDRTEHEEFMLPGNAELRQRQRKATVTQTEQEARKATLNNDITEATKDSEIAATIAKNRGTEKYAIPTARAQYEKAQADASNAKQKPEQQAADRASRENIAGLRAAASVYGTDVRAATAIRGQNAQLAGKVLQAGVQMRGQDQRADYQNRSLQIRQQNADTKRFTAEATKALGEAKLGQGAERLKQSGKKLEALIAKSKDDAEYRKHLLELRDAWKKGDHALAEKKLAQINELTTKRMAQQRELTLKALDHKSDALDKTLDSQEFRAVFSAMQRREIAAEDRAMRERMARERNALTKKHNDDWAAVAKAKGENSAEALRLKAKQQEERDALAERQLESLGRFRDRKIELEAEKVRRSGFKPVKLSSVPIDETPGVDVIRRGGDKGTAAAYHIHKHDIYIPLNKDLETYVKEEAARAQKGITYRFDDQLGRFLYYPLADLSVGFTSENQALAAARDLSGSAGGEDSQQAIDVRGSVRR